MLKTLGKETIETQCLELLGRSGAASTLDPKKGFEEDSFGLGEGELQLAFAQRRRDGTKGWSPPVGWFWEDIAGS